MPFKHCLYMVQGAFRFVIYEEEGQTLAHCLETDTVAAGEDLVSATKNLTVAIECEISHQLEHGGDPRSLYSPAPPEYWELLKKGKSLQAVHLKGYWGLDTSELDEVRKNLAHTGGRLTDLVASR